MYSPEELDIARKIKEEGGSINDARQAITKFRSDGTVQPVKPVTAPLSSGQETMQDVGETFSGIVSSFKKRLGTATEAVQATSLRPDEWMQGKQTPVESAIQVVAQPALLFSDILFEAAKGAVKLTQEGKTEEAIGKKVEDVMRTVADTPSISSLIQEYEGSSERTKRNLAIPLAVVDMLGFKLAGDAASSVRNASRGMRASGLVDEPPMYHYTVEPDGSVVRQTTDLTPDTVVSGVSQMATEASRLPGRVATHIRQAIQDAAERQNLIAESTPEVGNAISEGVDENLAKYVAASTPETAGAMRSMLDIGETGTRGQNVMDVPADFFVQQYDLLEKQRKAIGKELENAINNLPAAVVDMRPAYNQIDTLFREQLGVVRNADGSLDFSGSALTPEQRTLLTEANKLLREAGDVVDARTVHSKDSLFSTLNREAYRDGLQPILVEVQGIRTNLLEVLRDVYRSPLDTMSNGEIRRINTEYAKYRNAVDAIDNTILKVAKNTGVVVDPEEKASRLLGRLDTKAVSAPEFAKVVSDTDVMSRKLGYTGPAVTELVWFANDIVPLIKSPTVSRPGSFVGSIQGAVESVTKAGQPNAKDKIEALRKILDKINPTKAATIVATAYIASNPETVEAFADMVQDSPTFINSFIEKLTEPKVAGALTMLAIMAATSRALSPATIAAAQKQALKHVAKLEKSGASKLEIESMKRTAGLLTKAKERSLESSVEALEGMMKRLEAQGLGKSISFKNIYKARDAVYAELGGPRYPTSFESGMVNFNAPLGKGKGGTPEPTIKTKREVPMKDVAGNKLTVPEGTVISPSVNAKGQATITVNGKEYVVPKNQYDNLKNQSDISKATPFAPELEGTEVTVRASGLKDFQPSPKTDFRVMREGQSGTYYVANIRGKRIQSGFDTEAEAKTWLESSTDKERDIGAYKETKYSQYTLPGGENYREILVRAPMNYDVPLPSYAKAVQIKSGDSKGKWQIEVEGIGKASPLADSREEAILAYNKGTMSGSANSYKSSHWEEPNVLFHLRMNDRTWNGKKVSFMEEAQSDWARDGREKGFAQTYTELPEWVKPRETAAMGGAYKYEFELPEGGKVQFNSSRNKAEVKKDALDALNSSETDRVPSNPLLKNWQIPATKKALMDAVDRDADIFAWINGAQTSERYKLSRQIESIEWEADRSSGARFENGYKNIILKPKDNQSFNMLIDKTGKVYSAPPAMRDAEGKMLNEVLGKGMADAIMSKKSGTLEGEGLNFGGEWAHNLYDKQIRDIVKNLTGAEVKQADMGLPIGNGQNVWTIQSGPDVGGDVTASSIRRGMVVTEGNEDWVVVDLKNKDKFLAIQPSDLKKQNQNITEASYAKAIADGKYLKSDVQEFSLKTSATTAVQQYIELTPEVKAKIRGEAPKFTMKNPAVGEALPLILLMLGGGTLAAQEG